MERDPSTSVSSVDTVDRVAELLLYQDEDQK